ncbi:uncharacterized protein SPPG_02922 [Spizellomyces punctatus DAOM BR117]|uniref:Uncharacterized protein n=1 Tax=Spizellomyces punctatus (strain DAOM BR117) TaxID=645134 RepID=A0A0L0HN17_SPIPD|nr:uncharacterized protein SPPG_02922 [Spizellomyces punctatus DAOM BR117]KND02458.1 hypothetical protein SPPG_02922 [Spizellomyces punctatus DAOM BR117]|eukprot:XP_016610497.1 hypothetical protein SPPG_02922 [Spizellomyces punctatus DAOM BR117]
MSSANASGGKQASGKPQGVSHNVGGNTDINAESGGTKSVKGSDPAAKQAHTTTTSEKHWGTTQKYQTEEEAYSDQYGRAGGKGGQNDKNNKEEPDPTKLVDA